MPKPLTDKSAFEESMVWVQRVPSFHSHSIKFHPYSPKGLGSCNPSSFKSIALDSLYGFEDSTPFSEYLDDFSSSKESNQGAKKPVGSKGQGISNPDQPNPISKLLR
ncbi:UNVERIFIED_CONTAM: hypothetical protein Sangu_3213100 [Sesamum angustifolium]|uniref:Uncharacterized protein n=1 Tax=Sesamum angustifolium TaxID=2727405 RepID=A0AAW2JM10_9LAMI